MTLSFMGSVPTSLDDFRLITRTVRLVLSVPRYAMFALGFAFAGMSLFVLSRNLGLLINVVLSGGLPLMSRIKVLAELYPVIGDAYTLLQSLVLFATAAMIGVNLAVATYHFSEHDISLRQGSGSITGIVLGVFGAGCAACGSAILAGVLTVAGASGVLLLLPLDGLEFSVLALVAILLSLHWLAVGMRGGEINGCPVDI